MFARLLILFFFVSNSLWAERQCPTQYDHLGIPHLAVSSEDDFYYCFGLHHGTDRAWQMDYFRRVALGTNAEVNGFAHLKMDLMMRLLDLPKIASRLWNELPEKERHFLELYAEGVNQGFREGKNSAEFKLADFEPEAWKPQDSVLVLLLQSFDQTRKTFLKDYDEQKAIEDWGDKAHKLFWEDNLPWESTILKEGEYPKEDSAKVIPLLHKTKTKRTVKLWGEFPTISGEAAGSNNWVVAKENSQTGNALLANDPHLDLKTPIFWYWIHLRSPESEVIGASLPGAPAIVSGTNGKVAWGLTNAYINTADAVFVKNLPEEKLESVRPLVWIKWGFLKLPFFFKSFEKTTDGFPVLPLEVKAEHPMLLRWSGFYLKGDDLVSMLQMHHSKNIIEFDQHLKNVGLPSWNYVFTDVSGKIGYRVVGKLLKNRHVDGFGIDSETYDQFRVPEFLEPDERPHVMNPKRGYVMTANHKHWPDDAEFYGGRGYIYSFRGKRLDELLQDKKHDLESFQKIQCDRISVDARYFVPKLLKILDRLSLMEPEIKAKQELKNWDYQNSPDSLAPSFYRRFVDLLMENLKLNEAGLIRYLDEISQEHLEVFLQSFRATIAQVKNRPWGELHRLPFTHLSKNTDWVFSPEIMGLGDDHSVDPGTSTWNEERGVYEQTGGASMRMIIEMKKKPEVYLSLPGRNRAYDSYLPAGPWQEWARCQYNKLEW